MKGSHHILYLDPRKKEGEERVRSGRSCYYVKMSMHGYDGQKKIPEMITFRLVSLDLSVNLRDIQFKVSSAIFDS